MMKAIAETVVFPYTTTIVCVEGKNAGVLWAMKRVMGGKIR
jgi:hypothetical protein